MKYLFVALLLMASLSFATEPVRIEYRVLDVSKTSTMEKELNEAAADGFSIASMMGGESAFGGKEMVVVMSRQPDSVGKKRYKLLATSKTSTLEKEMQQAGEAGYDYCGQTIFESAFGGKEVSVILQQDSSAPAKRIDYRLLATSRTSTMQEELRSAGERGFQLVGMMVGKTLLGGKEVVSILRKYE